ncbi:Cytochrome P450 [Penicillium bovifimosum]|uniref:Cytochrome P450 n=1 Tax=Penicillium bovifimosum TaxID=126998 RepID=A0A9W9HCK0_9EURO|nr:Cytochrome P450 [Penicillium bovifimosum]KAJ5144230.1 Cytochrome P450 [Penicillium bovifimosum]
MLQDALAHLILARPDSVAFRELGGLASVVLVLFALICTLYLPVTPPSRKGQSPPILQLPGWKVTQSFFEKRFDFIQTGFRATSSSIWQTTLFKNNAIVLSTDVGREVFFKTKDLALYDTFSIVIGRGASFDPHTVSGIVKRMASMQRPGILQNFIPLLLSDCQRAMNSWGSERNLDPCSSFHQITFHLIMRIACADIANDPILLSHLKPLFDGVDNPGNPHSTWLPWLPGPVFFQKILCSIQTYRSVQSAIKARKRSGIKADDMLQQMLDDGGSTTHIFGFMLGLSLAGSRSTGTILSWVIMNLASHPKWFLAVEQEIQTLISTHASSSPSVTGGDLTQTLSEIPLSAWESQTPNLDICIRETLRASQPYTAVRKNTGPDITIGPYTIPSGSLVMYPFSDTALNPNFYPEPLRWNPSRATEQGTPSLTWGAGKHACKGQRLGTLMIKLVVACALMRFNITMVDGEGARMNNPPTPDWNDQATCRPKEQCGIKVVAKSE